MADSRTADTPSSRPPHRTQSSGTARHVCFSDLPTKHGRSTPPLHNNNNNNKCRPFCLSLCAWVCLSIFAFVLLVLLLGALFASFLHTALPVIAVRGLEFSKLEAQDRNSGRATGSIDANFQFLVEFSNRNEKIAVSFGPLAVEASAERIKLGKTRIGAFSQTPKNTTEVRVSTAVKRSGVNGEDAEQMVSDLNNSEAALEVTFKGNAGFHLGGIDIDGVPVLISCNPRKTEVGQGKKSRCSVSFFSP